MLDYSVALVYKMACRLILKTVSIMSSYYKEVLKRLSSEDSLALLESDDPEIIGRFKFSMKTTARLLDLMSKCLKQRGFGKKIKPEMADLVVILAGFCGELIRKECGDSQEAKVELVGRISTAILRDVGVLDSLIAMSERAETGQVNN